MTIGEAIKVLEMLADENTLLKVSDVKEVASMVIPTTFSYKQMSSNTESLANPTVKQNSVAKGFEPIKDSWSPRNI